MNAFFNPENVDSVFVVLRDAVQEQVRLIDRRFRGGGGTAAAVDATELGHALINTVVMKVCTHPSQPDIMDAMRFDTLTMQICDEVLPLQWNLSSQACGGTAVCNTRRLPSVRQVYRQGASARTHDECGCRCSSSQTSTCTCPRSSMPSTKPGK